MESGRMIVQRGRGKDLSQRRKEMTDYNKMDNEEMEIKRLAKELRKQVKFIIDWEDVEDMKDAIRYLANINIRAAEDARESVRIAMRNAKRKES